MSGISGQVCLRRGETLAAGCCWIYDNEIDWADDTCEDGGLVEVLDSRMRYQGTGFFNRRSIFDGSPARPGFGLRRIFFADPSVWKVWSTQSTPAPSKPRLDGKSLAEGSCRTARDCPFIFCSLKLYALA